MNTKDLQKLKGFLKLLWSLLRGTVIAKVVATLDEFTYEDDVVEMIEAVAGSKGVIQRQKWLGGSLRRVLCDVVKGIDEKDLEKAKAKIIKVLMDL